jgi:hypothetical protein
MIYTNNILALLLVLAIWAIDTWLFVAGLRLILSLFPSIQHSNFCHSLAELVDPLTQTVVPYVSRWSHRSIPPWLPWVIIILAAIVVRHVLAVLVVFTT